MSKAVETNDLTECHKGLVEMAETAECAPPADDEAHPAPAPVDRPPDRLRSAFRGIRLRVMRFGRFAIVGASGIFVNEFALAAFVVGLGSRYIVGYLLATQVSTFWNFLLIEFWAFKAADLRGSRLRRWAKLMVVNNLANLATAPLFLFCTSVLGINYLVSNLLTLGLVVLARFTLADRIWTPSPKESGSDVSGAVVLTLSPPNASSAPWA